MSWVALEHAFTRHPKISALSDAEFRAWIRLLCWSAEYRTRGRVDHVGSEVPGIDKRRLRRYVDVGLLDLHAFDTGEVHMVIHDWEEFNGTARERQQAKERKRAQRDREKALANGHGDTDDDPF